MFTTAITRTPCPNIYDGITSVNIGKPNYQKALSQHQDYINALEECGLNVVVLEAANQFPDSTFVEDVAVCTPHCTIITNPGAPTRNKETTIISSTLQTYFNTIEKINAPGTLEGGDVMMVGDTYYIGLSERTNKLGAQQFIQILESYGMRGIIVPLNHFLHLKSGLSYLENNNLLISGEFIGNELFFDYNLIFVDEDEAYAANSVWINGTVLVPSGFPKTKEKIQALGYRIIEVDTSEFMKIDGGLSCLSLRF